MIVNLRFNKLIHISKTLKLYRGSAPKPTTPNREQDKKVKSARPPKIKKDPSQSSQEDQLALLARPPPTQFSTEASTQDQEYADDYENEFDDDYAGPITDWGFLIPSGESEQVIIDQNEIPSNKEKKQKKKKSKHIPKVCNCCNRFLHKHIY